MTESRGVYIDRCIIHRLMYYTSADVLYINWCIIHHTMYYTSIGPKAPTWLQCIYFNNCKQRAIIDLSTTAAGITANHISLPMRTGISMQLFISQSCLEHFLSPQGPHKGHASSRVYKNSPPNKSLFARLQTTYSPHTDWVYSLWITTHNTKCMHRAWVTFQCSSVCLYII